MRSRTFSLPDVRIAGAATACLAAVAITFSARTASAEPFRLAATVDQGVFSRSAAYAFDGILVPGFDIGRLRLAATAGAALANPDWTFIAGFRPSFVLWAPVSNSTGLRLVTDVSYLTQQTSYRLTGGFTVDTESFQIGVLGGYDSFHDSLVVLTTIGFDIPTIYRFFADGWLAPGPSPCGK
jgi:hypothetical protein